MEDLANDSFDIDNSDDTLGSPTYDDLIDVGFDEDSANEILDTHAEDAQRLLDVMHEANDIEVEAERLIEDNEASLVYGNSDGDGTHFQGDTNDLGYKNGADVSFGSCDCRSECEYNTGKTWQSADYGYSG